MNKYVKKFISLVSVGAIAASVAGLSACGKNKNRSDTLYIEAAQLGYGLDWLDAIAGAWANETGNKYKITRKVGSEGTSAITTEIESLASNHDIFIYRGSDLAKKVYQGGVTVKGQKYDNIYLDLTDLVNAELDGEGGATIASKLNVTYKNTYQINGKYYGLPWMEGIMGIVRNVSVWDSLELTDADIPVTTDQMFAVCDKIKKSTANTDIAPFMYCAEDEYYSSFMFAWFMQYECSENVQKYLAGKDPEGNISKNLFSYDGQREMFNVVEQLVSANNGYQNSKSQSLNFTSMQGQFLKGQAVFCVNGAWIELEQGASFPNVKIDYIATPIISALSKKLSFYSDGADDEGDDAKLAAIVKYVRGQSGEKPEFATDEDIEIVRDANKYQFASQGGAHVLAASSYSPKSELIKSFITYMYSDKGMKEYYKATNGATLPLELSKNSTYDDIALSTFQQSVQTIDRASVFVFQPSSKIFSIGGVDFKMFNGKASDYIKKLYEGSLTAAGVVTANKTYLESNWTQISSKIK